ALRVSGSDRPCVARAACHGPGTEDQVVGAHDVSNAHICVEVWSRAARAAFGPVRKTRQRARAVASALVVLCVRCPPAARLPPRTCGVDVRSNSVPECCNADTRDGAKLLWCLARDD